MYVGDETTVSCNIVPQDQIPRFAQSMRMKSMNVVGQFQDSFEIILQDLNMVIWQAKANVSRSGSRNKVSPLRRKIGPQRSVMNSVHMESSPFTVKQRDD